MPDKVTSSRQTEDLADHTVDVGVIDRGITIRQPWASLIALGVKTFETRSRPTSYRGPVMIHAAKAAPQKFVGDFFCEMYDRWADRNWCMSGPNVPDWPLPLGAVVAVAEIVDSLPVLAFDDELDKAWKPHIAPTRQCDNESVTEMGHWLGRSPDDGPMGRPTWRINDITDQLPYGDWTPGRWAHQLANVRPLDVPVPCKGSQAIPWRADQATIDAVAEQIGGA